VKRVVSKDLDQASREMAPESHPQALFDLGEKYFHGDGVPQDYREALKWLRPAAEQGHFMSQLYLGTMYGRGDLGVLRDLVQSYVWFCLAATQEGCPTDVAVERREYVARLMNPAQIAEVQRRAREFNVKDIIPAKPARRNVLCCA
jgi:TPR repeat protein